MPGADTRGVPYPYSLLAALVLCFTLLPAHAAGGHFDVDDATIAEPGHCQLEAWLGRAHRIDAQLQHLGPACRGGPVELGLNADRTRGGGGVQRSLGPQVKWVADPAAQRLSLGLVWATPWDRRHAQTLYVPLTAWATTALQLHLNAGWDRMRGVDTTRRWGAAGEWAAGDAASVLLEHSRIVGERVSRLGGRWNLSSRLSLDLSLSRHRPAEAGGYTGATLGLNQDFGG